MKTIHLQLVHTTTKSQDGDSWVTWAVFPASWTDEQIKEAVSNSFDFDGSHYGGPGQAFYSRATIYRGRSRVLVTQRGGLDV